MGRLSPELLSLWEELHELSDPPAGPFLHPDYARAVDRVRSDVEVGVITEDGAAVGFLPFQRLALGIGAPVGARLCDLCGVVVRPSVTVDPGRLTRDLGLRVLRLPHVPVGDSVLGPSSEPSVAAPYIDVSAGFEAYRQASLDSGSSFMSQVERRSRRLERDVGRLRFEWHTDDDGVFDTLVRWKGAQRRATGTANVLDLPWARDLMRVLRTHSGEGLRPVLSAMWVGETLAAAHFGIRTDRVLHYWIPAYNVELAKYSPGLIALVAMVRDAAERGVERFDLGPGEERYKERAATGSPSLGTATLASDPATGKLVEFADRIRTWSKESRVGAPVRAASRSAIRGGYRARSVVGGAVRSLLGLDVLPDDERAGHVW